MIFDRIRARLDRSGSVPAAPADVLAARETRIAQLEKQLSTETFLSVKLGADVERLAKENTDLKRRILAEAIEVGRLSAAQHFPPVATCECGGDAELHLRRQIVAAEQRALRDRANAVVLDNRLAAAEGRPVIGSLV